MLPKINQKVNSMVSKILYVLRQEFILNRFSVVIGFGNMISWIIQIKSNCCTLVRYHGQFLKSLLTMCFDI